MERNHNIDLVKGILILFVIIGHFIPGKLTDQFSRHTIYLFHMSIFLGVAGYLSPLNKETHLKNLMKRYCEKLIVPWLLAVYVYMILYNTNINNLRTYLDLYLRPRYHLWFPIGLILFSALTYLCLNKIKLSINYLVVISFVISLFFKLVPINTLNIPNNIEYIVKVIYRFNPEYWCFFNTGLYIRNQHNHNESPSKFNLAFSCLAFFLIFPASSYLLFKNPFSDPLFLITFSLNIPLLYIILTICKKELLPRFKIIEFIGINSYPFYLWHVVGKFIFSSIYNQSKFLYYLVVILWIIILGLLIRFGKKNKTINKYLLGT